MKYNLIVIAIMFVVAFLMSEWDSIFNYFYPQDYRHIRVGPPKWLISISVILLFCYFGYIEYVNKQQKNKKTKKEPKIVKKDLSMVWYNIMTYGMIPFFLLICILTLMSWGGFFTVVVLILTTVSIIGLHQKSEWAPDVFIIFIYTSFLPIILDYLNYRNSFLNELAVPTNSMGSGDGALSLILITWIIWSMPNHIYFSKRKHLFVN